MKTKVAVGLSGGVDSAVAAYLLQQQGYDVIGVFMRNWDAALNQDIKGNPHANDQVCPQEEDYKDAKAVADFLHIPLHRVDFVNEYWNDVFEQFINAFKAGLTPNPDIWCNKYIKFNYFLNYAKSELHANFIAMGHYAGVRLNPETNKYELVKAADKAKDQTYFLCQLNQNQLKHTLFPLAKLKKAEVRALAAKIGLPVANKKDSTGICFIGERRFQEFLENYIPAQSGPIIDIATQTPIGRHKGVFYYTIGQNKGLNLGGMASPYFVVGKDVKQNVLYVAQKNEAQWLMSTGCDAIQVHWISGEPPALPLNCMIKTRYRQPEHPARVVPVNVNAVTVYYETELKAVTPGQWIVFYAGDVCLGGGIINATFNHQGKMNYVRNN